MTAYDIVIGLEVHSQLSTKSKLFCGCKLEFGAEPNTLVCPVCLGMPGVLPVPNRQAIEYAVRLGLATNCEINQNAMWTRKNYFYPDSPKGYQITQQGGTPEYDQPICQKGFLEVTLKNGDVKRIRINRIHMEEDAGKLTHDLSPTESHFDANRCGTPLLEIVTEPDLKSSEEALLYLEKLKQIIEYIEVSDANMEKGNFRCDVNISLRETENDPLGSKVEMKNMNSFSNIEKALHFEIENQTIALDDKQVIEQVTKRYDPNKDVTVPMRSKEAAQDYRYFPEPDLLKINFVDDAFIEKIRATMPELPEARRHRFAGDYNLNEYDSQVLTAEKKIADYFEEVCKGITQYKLAANWIMGEVLRVVKETDSSIDELPVQSHRLAELLKLIEDKVISGKIAKQVFQEMLTSQENPADIVDKKGLKVVADEGAIEKLVLEVIEKNPNQVAEYREGKTKLFGFFMGQIMKASQGKASTDIVTPLLREKLAG